MALKHFWWGPSLDLLWDSCNGALWVEHCCSWQVVENEPLTSILLLNISLLTHGYSGSPSKMNSICISVILTCFSQSTHRSFVSLNFSHKNHVIWLYVAGNSFRFLLLHLIGTDLSFYANKQFSLKLMGAVINYWGGGSIISKARAQKF